MRKVYTLLALLLFKSSCFAQDAVLTNLYQKKKYITLLKYINQPRTKALDREIYHALLFSVFGKADTSNILIDKILLHNLTLPDTLKYMLLDAQHNNHVHLFNYKKAYETKQFLTNNYTAYIKPENLFDEQQTMNIWKSIQDVPPQTIMQKNTIGVSIDRDIVNLQRIPVTRNGKRYSFIFDTGAGISTITDSMANVLHLKVIDKIPIIVKSGITGIGTNVKLGIADKLNIGEVEVRNVLFLIFPDSALTFNIAPTTRYKLDAILGFPVIKELGVITIYKNKLTICKNDIKEQYSPNMVTDYLKPILFFSYEGEDLPFTFDTGADETLLTELFYERYKSIVNKKGVNKVVQYGGAGGGRALNVYVMPYLKLKSNSEIIALKNVSVSVDKIHTGEGIYYGNLGQDVIRKYTSITINFKQSWIKFNK